jgi:hypothetical protein
MKILFLKTPREDYLGDMILHGLRQLSEVEVIDYPRQSHMYSNYQGRELYGKGFGIFKTLLPIEIDRSDMERRVEGREFDLIIYGALEDRDLVGFEEVLKIYTPKEVVFLDGLDHTFIREFLVTSGFYFKRELQQDRSDVHPISFCFPKEKVAMERKIKRKDWATCIPGHKDSYVFETEEEMYGDYQESHFAYTWSKQGWDCQRHYEIIFNRCIPCFPGLEYCHENTMKWFPKERVITFWSQILHRGVFEAADYEEQIFRHALKHLTTEAMARYVLETVTC